MTLFELYRSIDHTNGVEQLETYVAEGGDVNSEVGESGQRLLQLAVEHQNHDLIRALIAAGAKPDLYAHGTLPPLHHAADIDIDSIWQSTQGLDGVDFSTVDLLLSLGADPDICDDEGKNIHSLVEAYDSGQGDGKRLAEVFDSLLERRGAFGE